MKKKLKYICLIEFFIILALIFLCIYFFLNSIPKKVENSIEYIPNYSIFLEDKPIIFRDSIGRKIELIQKDNILYVPLNVKGLFLNNRIEKNKDVISITKIDSYGSFVDINCESLNGRWITTDTLAEYDYTIIFNWATWCSDCDKVLEDLDSVLKDLENKNILFLGILMNNPNDINNFKKEVQSKLTKYNISFENLVLDKELQEQLQSNIPFIPNFYILNSKSKIISNDIVDIKALLKKLEKVIEAECDRC